MQNAPEGANVTFTVSNVIDSLGVTHSMLINAVKSASPNTWDVTVSMESASPVQYVVTFDSDGRISDVKRMAKVMEPLLQSIRPGTEHRRDK